MTTGRRIHDGEQKGEEKLIAAAIVEIADGFGEDADLVMCGATLVETDDCYLILESPLHGEYEGERFVRSVSYSWETISGSWFRWYGLAAPASDEYCLDESTL